MDQKARGRRFPSKEGRHLREHHRTMVDFRVESLLARDIYHRSLQ